MVTSMQKLESAPLVLAQSERVLHTDSTLTQFSVEIDLFICKVSIILEWYKHLKQQTRCQKRGQLYMIKLTNCTVTYKVSKNVASIAKKMFYVSRQCLSTKQFSIQRASVENPLILHAAWLANIQISYQQ